MPRTVKAAILIMMATLASKISGFLREITLAAILGTTRYTDAYLISLTIPSVLFDIFIQSFAMIIMPFFLNIREKEGRECANSYINNQVHIAGFISLLIAILAFLAAKPLVRVVALGFDDDVLNLAVMFTRILLPMTLFTGINYVFTAYMQAEGSFAAPILVCIPSNLIIIAGTFLSQLYGMMVLVWSTLIGISLQLLFQLPFVFRKGYRYRWTFRLDDPNTKQTLALTVPVFLNMFVQKMNNLIDKSMASTLADGSISALNFAHIVDLFIFAVISTSISTAVYQSFSQKIARGDREGCAASMQQAYRFMLIILVPVSVGTIVLSKPIVKLLFQRGAFDERAVAMTATALQYYAVGIAGYGLKDMLSRGFYALKDTRTPMVNGMIAVGVNVILNLLLIRSMGHGGLALATGISSLVAALLLYLRLCRKVGDMDIKKTGMSILKVVLASVVMGILVKLTYSWAAAVLTSGALTETISFLLSVGVGALVYFIQVLLLRVDEVKMMVQPVIKRILRA